MSLFHISLAIVLLLKLTLRFRVIIPVRLACLIHVASIHPELGSNSNLRQDLIVRGQSLLRFILLCAGTFLALQINHLKDETKESVNYSLASFAYAGVSRVRTFTQHYLGREGRNNAG